MECLRINVLIYNNSNIMIMKTNVILFLFLSVTSVSFAAGAVTTTAYAEQNLFPYITVQSLDDRQVSLPYEVTSTGKISLVTIAFSKPDDNDISSWVKPFIDNFEGNSKTTYFEIALVGDIGILNGLIFNNMRGGASDDKKKHVLVYFKDKDVYKRLLNITDDSLIYIYLLDKHGLIKLIKSGKKAS